MGIIIFADFDPKGYVHAVAFFTWGYDFLFKFILGRCDTKIFSFIVPRNSLPSTGGAGVSEGVSSA